MGLVPLKEAAEKSLALSPCEDAAGTHQTPNMVVPLDFPAYRTVRNKCVFYKPRVYDIVL